MVTFLWGQRLRVGTEVPSRRVTSAGSPGVMSLTEQRVGLVHALTAAQEGMRVAGEGAAGGSFCLTTVYCLTLKDYG